MPIAKRSDAQTVIQALTPGQPFSFYLPMLPGDVTYARGIENVTRTTSFNGTARNETLTDAEAAQRLYQDRRFYNAQLRHTARQES